MPARKPTPQTPDEAGVSETLARYVVESRLADIPDDVKHEARRALLNYVGCAIGGAGEEGVEIAMRVIGPFSGERTSAVLGRRERLDPLNASLINGLSSHYHDYDDTTPKNYSHTTSPVASALFAYASANAVSGQDLFEAFILGFEAASRVGNSVYPGHYDTGWHITGTIGVIGAAVAIGRLRGLPLRNMIWAIGTATTQSAGLREQFGSMGKPFHPGRSAQSGYLAALLAEQGFTSGNYPIESPRGFAAVLSPSHDFSKITDGLGVDFDLRENTYKPYASGIVIHPTIDACSQIRAAHGLDLTDVESVQLTVAPIVLDLCNKKFIATGLEGKFSVYHAAAIGLVRGQGRLGEFTDETVNDPEIRRIRESTHAERDASLEDDAVIVEVRRKSGEPIRLSLDHALGNIHRPLSDAQLEDKFRDQARQHLTDGQIDDLIGLCWQVDTLDRAGRIAEAAVPKG
ncbi:MmgE/PrpD family protein [uncultured Enterovirga sp.]|uniref:MmgE/PrpD family protein n=1 Tax=uncultured Enterovirga sp. TaxID=2026352 RepID=UPI0035C94654